MKSKPVFNDKIRPVFIIGAPRSGTSIMTWVLGQHPNIQPMPETSWIASMAVAGIISHKKGGERGKFSSLSNVKWPAEPFLRRIGESIHQIVCDVFEERCQQIYGNYKKQGRLLEDPSKPIKNRHLRRHIDDQKTRWVDGTPFNTMFIWGLATMFPAAKFIHNLRKPKEVAMSLESFDKAGGSPQNLKHGLQTWIDYTENAVLAEIAYGPERVFQLGFERIKKDPEQLMRELMCFLDEEYHPNCLLPLAEKINSSHVTEKQHAENYKINKIKLFKTADALYEQAISKSMGITPCDSVQLLRDRLMMHTVDRDLV